MYRLNLDCFIFSHFAEGVKFIDKRKDEESTVYGIH